MRSRSLRKRAEAFDVLDEAIQIRSHDGGINVVGGGVTRDSDGVE